MGHGCHAGVMWLAVTYENKPNSGSFWRKISRLLPFVAVMMKQRKRILVSRLSPVCHLSFIRFQTLAVN